MGNQEGGLQSFLRTLLSTLCDVICNGGRKTTQLHSTELYPAFLKWWTKNLEGKGAVGKG